MLSFSLADSLISELKRVDSKLAKTATLVNGLTKDERNFIARNAFISNIGASTRIENAVLTDAEIDWVDTALTHHQGPNDAYLDQKVEISDKLSLEKERSLDEVAGCRALLQLVLTQNKELFPITEATIRGLHKELLQYFSPADRFSGSYKLYNNAVYRYVGDKKYPVLVTAEPGSETEIAMQQLVSWYNTTLPKHPWPIAVAVEFVYRFLTIHPFEDGNGRLGRALLYLTLLQSSEHDLSDLTKLLPIDRHIEKHREEYYLVLRQGSEGKYNPDPHRYNYEPFLKFILKVMSDAIDDVDFYRQKYENLQRLTQSERRVLSEFKEQPELRLQTKDLVNATGLPRTTVSDSLRTLLRIKLIQRTGRNKATQYQLIF